MTEASLNPTAKTSTLDPRAAELARRVAYHVRRLSLAAGLDQGELAERAHLDRRHVQKVEAGANNLELDTIQELAVALDVDASELFTEIPAGAALPARSRGRPRTTRKAGRS